MTEIKVTHLSPELASEVRRLVLEDQSGSDATIPDGFVSEANAGGERFRAVATADIPAMTGSTGPVGSGTVNLYTLNTGTSIYSNLVSAGVTAKNDTRENISNGDWCWVEKDQFGDYWIRPDVADAVFPRFRFRLYSGFDDTGTAIAEILDIYGAVTVPDGSGERLAVKGDQITVHDPKKQFAHAVGDTDLTNTYDNNTQVIQGGSIGYAVKTSQTLVDPDNPTSEEIADASQYPRFEVESCTQICNKMRCKTLTGIPAGSTIKGQAADESVTLYFDANADMASMWPYVDYDTTWNTTTETGFTHTVVVKNHERFTALPNSEVTIERFHIGARVEDAENIDTPYSQLPAATEEWHITNVSKPIARWAKFTYSSGSWTYANAYKEGENPASFFETVPGEGAGGIDGECTSSGAAGWGFFDPNSQKYIILATTSAMLGEPKSFDFVEPGVHKDGCKTCYKKTTNMKAFGCDSGDDPLQRDQNECTQDKNQTSVQVMTGISGGYNCISPSYAEIVTCSSIEPGTPGPCMPICADPCDPCTGDCVWTAVENPSWHPSQPDPNDPPRWIWENTTPCPGESDPDCECPKPCDNPTSGNDVHNATCGDASGCGCDCCNFTPSDYLSQISVTWPVGPLGSSVTGSLSSTGGPFYITDSAAEGSNCQGTITFAMDYASSGCLTTCRTTGNTAHLVYNTTYQCCYWVVNLVQPDCPCPGGGGANMGDGWPGGFLKVPGCTGVNNLECNSFQECNEVGCDTGGFVAVTFLTTATGTCTEPTDDCEGGGGTTGNEDQSKGCDQYDGKQLCLIGGSATGPVGVYGTPIWTLTITAVKFVGCTATFEWELNDYSAIETDPNGQVITTNGKGTVTAALQPDGSSVMRILGLPDSPTGGSLDAPGGALPTGPQTPGDPTGIYAQGGNLGLPNVVGIQIGVC